MKEQFEIYLIKPTRYCEEGYPLQWVRSWMSSNSLATVNGLVIDSISRDPLGPNVQANIHVIDETIANVNPAKICRTIKKSGRKSFVALIGVQTNQFPRSVDLARQFIQAGMPVCIGGFHVSGCLSMLKDMPDDLKEAQAMGISFFAGEAEEGRMDQVIIDAYHDRLKPVYNYMNDLPSLENAPTPILPKDTLKSLKNMACMDLGRGCPFDCSFCTIINVQGRKSRFRTADDLENIVRENYEQGIDFFFLTDDNFARNKNWKLFTDRLIKLKKEEGIKVTLSIQIDTLTHQIDGFIEACVAAGVAHLFIGLENINPDNLEIVNKRQNRIEDYREMLLAWKKHSVLITCGYIIGFPNDTKESILNDIEILKANLAIDTLYINYLTPLPGSVDHKKMYEAGVWMDPDMNKYELNNRVVHHSTMSDEEWEDAYKGAYDAFYSWDHLETILKRMFALGSNKKIMTVDSLCLYREGPRIEGQSPMDSGWIRLYRRTQRRYGMALENPFIFYPKYFWQMIKRSFIWGASYARLYLMMKKIGRDPNRMNYMDNAINGDSKSVDEDMFKSIRMTNYAQKRIDRTKSKAS